MRLPENLLDQGTIIYGIRSDKYPNLRCYGIIITASCDIAQQKVSKLYYLLAIDATEWFCSTSIEKLNSGWMGSRAEVNLAKSTRK